MRYATQTQRGRGLLAIDAPIGVVDGVDEGPLWSGSGFCFCGWFGGCGRGFVEMVADSGEHGC